MRDRWAEVQELYATANDVLGKPIKVTPTSKVVGDLALYLASNDLDAATLVAAPEAYDLPDSVLGYLCGQLGTPPAGFPEPFRARAVRGREVEVGDLVLTEREEKDLAGLGRREVLSRLLFPKPYSDYLASRQEFGDVSVIPTEAFWFGLQPGRAIAVSFEAGVDVLVELETIGAADEDGMINLHMKVNGSPRTVVARDRSVEPRRQGALRANVEDRDQLGASLPGLVTFQVALGDKVSRGHPLAITEAMKMESTLFSPRDAIIAELAVDDGSQVEAGDLLIVLSESVA